jgi:CTP synthase (UTP-ammonia lyase)
MMDLSSGLLRFLERYGKECVLLDERFNFFMRGEIVVVGDFDPKSVTHIATNRAIEHAGRHLNASPDFQWLETQEAEYVDLDRVEGFWIAPGSPYKSLAGALRVIRFARENMVPLLGTCGGFQHVILEFARNVLGIADAAHAEYDPYASRLFISKLTCSLVGRSLAISLSAKSLAASLYGTTSIKEQYYCNFGVNPEYVSKLRSGKLRIVGSDPEGEVRVVELEDHPFFIGTLFVPQSGSTPERPHPIIKGFLEAIFRRKAVRS